MTQKEKHEAICSMQSIGQRTYGEYPTLRSFKKALSENRVAGDYDRRVVILSNDANGEYTFIKD